MQNLAALQRSFSEQGILMCFNGSFTHGIIEEIGTAIRRYLEGEKLTSGSITDVFAVYIEQTQNVKNYLERRRFAPEARNAAVIVIGNAGGMYQVCSGNTIAHSDIEELTSRLETVNSLDKTGLRKFYKERIREPHDPASPSAGLGLIDIARRASTKLEYSFQTIDEEYSFFSLSVSVAGEQR
ncbi:MAG: SiaB family protein kinase [Treponemataceae bacterium]